MPDEIQSFRNATTGAVITVPIPDGDLSREMYARMGFEPCETPEPAADDAVPTPDASAAPQTPPVPPVVSEQGDTSLDNTPPEEN